MYLIFFAWKSSQKYIRGTFFCNEVPRAQKVIWPWVVTQWIVLTTTSWLHNNSSSRKHRWASEIQLKKFEIFEIVSQGETGKSRLINAALTTLEEEVIHHCLKFQPAISEDMHMDVLMKTMIVISFRIFDRVSGVSCIKFCLYLLYKRRDRNVHNI